MKLNTIFVFLLSIFGTGLFAQKNNDDKLALQYLEQKEYEKANVYLEKLYDKSPDQ